MTSGTKDASRAERSAVRPAMCSAPSGATAIEYGLIAAGISIAIVAIVGTVGDSLVATFTSVDNSSKSDSM